MVNSRAVSCDTARVVQKWWLLLSRRELLRPELVGQFVNGPVEFERQAVAVIHSSASIYSDVKRFVQRHEERNRMLHLLLGQHAAIHLEDASAALAQAGSVIFEKE